MLTDKHVSNLSTETLEKTSAETFEKQKRSRLISGPPKGLHQNANHDHTTKPRSPNLRLRDYIASFNPLTTNWPRSDRAMILKKARIAGTPKEFATKINKHLSNLRLLSHEKFKSRHRPQKDRDRTKLASCCHHSSKSSEHGPQPPRESAPAANTILVQNVKVPQHVHEPSSQTHFIGRHNQEPDISETQALDFGRRNVTRNTELSTASMAPHHHPIQSNLLGAS